MIKLIDLLLEKHMTPAQKKKRGEIFDTLVAGGMKKSKAGPIATSKAMKEAESNLTPLQQYLYDYEVEISGEDFALEVKNKIDKLETLKDVKEYYLYYRGWVGDESLEDLLFDFIIDLKME